MKNTAIQRAIDDFRALLSKVKKTPTQGVTPDPTKQKLETIRKNTIDQTPYTPQAKAYVQSLPLEMFGGEQQTNSRNTLAGGDYNPNANATRMTPNGRMIDNQYQPMGTIGLNSRSMIPGSQFPVSAMRHEAVHAMDANVHYLPFVTNGPDWEGGNIQASYTPEGKWSGDSYQFFNLLRNMSPEQAKYFYNMLQQSPSYGNGKIPNPGMVDTETFAHVGQNLGVMLNPQLAQQYKNIYYPMTKAINYSPVYPSPELMGANTQE